jgi:cell division protein FtsB
LDYSRIAAVSVIQLAKEIVKLKAQNEELLNRIKVLENSV